MIPTTELIVVIGVVTTSFVSIISAFGQFWGKNSQSNVVKKLDDAEIDRNAVKKKLDDTHQKVENVQENTNGRLTAASKRIAELEAMNAVLSNGLDRRKPVRKAR